MYTHYSSRIFNHQSGISKILVKSIRITYQIVQKGRQKMARLNFNAYL